MGTEQFRAFFTLRILSHYAESRPWDHGFMIHTALLLLPLQEHMSNVSHLQPLSRVLSGS